MHPLLRVLICFATEAEAAAFRQLARILGGVSILISGVGPENAEASLRRAFEGTKPTLVISSGFAGGLRPGLPRGTMLFDAAPPEIAAQLTALGAQRARFHTDRRIATTADDKRALFAATNADAVEMESGALRALCEKQNIPFAIVRVISDAADENLPLDFNRLMDASMNLSYLRLAAALIASPGKIAELREFKGRIDFCARRQATVLASLIVQLRNRV